MAWRAAEFVYVHLRTCHRIGASEREFVQLMGRIRRGEARDKDYDRLNKVCACVEITSASGALLGDDAAVPAQSSDEGPAPSRHRAGVASMAWRTTRRHKRA